MKLIFPGCGKAATVPTFHQNLVIVFPRTYARICGMCTVVNTENGGKSMLFNVRETEGEGKGDRGLKIPPPRRIAVLLEALRNRFGVQYTS